MKVICTVKSSVIASVAMFFGLCALYLYNLWGWKVNDIGNCDATDSMAFFLYMIVPWLTGALYAYVPLLVIFITSVAITYKLARAKWERRVSHYTL